ncbi:MAG: DNA-binding response regulator [Bacteroidetes bacterium B1(2017)]|nr:MAG: DNA-binding response regulator [Bacteroidetes bacterium B1(2017)]
MDKNKILLAEDDPHLGFVIKEGLTQQGFEVSLCENGLDALNQFVKEPYNICLLDVMMPQMDGYTLAEKLREIDSHVPIIFLTAKGLKEDKILGFKAGADDYLVKPFSMEELLLRIQVFLTRNRKSNPVPNLQVQKLGSYLFHPVNFELSLNDKVIRLTKKEGAILSMLMNQPGMLIKREVLLAKIWGNDDYFAGRSMDVYISRLRKYLKDDPNIELSNHHGMGFMIQVKNAT